MAAVRWRPLCADRGGHVRTQGNDRLRRDNVGVGEKYAEAEICPAKLQADGLGVIAVIPDLSGKRCRLAGHGWIWGDDNLRLGVTRLTQLPQRHRRPPDFTNSSDEIAMHVGSYIHNRATIHGQLNRI